MRHQRETKSEQYPSPARLSTARRWCSCSLEWLTVLSAIANFSILSMNKRTLALLGALLVFVVAGLPAQ